MKVHHIGYLVKDIAESMKEFSFLGYHVEQDVVEDLERGIKVLFLVNRECRIELIEPMKNSNLFQKSKGITKRIGNSPYHICYELEKLGGQWSS